MRTATITKAYFPLVGFALSGCRTSARARQSDTMQVDVTEAHCHGLREL
ncbi:hypothetical protein [Symmachiella dynata]